MAQKRKPTVFVLLPGAFTRGSIYHKVTSQLQDQGYEVLEIDLPSVGRRDAGPATMEDDVDHIRATITRLAQEGKNVVVAASSYSGFPMTEAAKGLRTGHIGAATGPQDGGGLVHLVYIASFLPPPDTPLSELVGDRVRDILSSTAEYIEPPPPEAAGSRIFSDLGESEQLHYASQMTCHSPLTFAGTVTYPAYLHVPTTAVLCERDRSMDLRVGRENVDAAIEKGSGTVRKVSIASDHYPMVSHPDELVGILLEAAKA